MCNNEDDDKCHQQRSQLEEIHHLCTNENIQFAISTNITIAEKYFNIYGSFPKLFYFRNGFPVMYSGNLTSSKYDKDKTLWKSYFSIIIKRFALKY